MEKDGRQLEKAGHPAKELPAIDAGQTIPSAISNLNLHIKTEPVTVKADATIVYCTYIWPRNYKCTVASALTMKDSVFCRVILFF